jgi:hypothetical protein
MTGSREVAKNAERSEIRGQKSDDGASGVHFYDSTHAPISGELSNPVLATGGSPDDPGPCCR